MADKEIITKVYKVGDELMIPVPKEFSEGTTVKNEAEIKLIINERGNIEAQANKIVAKEVKCRICEWEPAKFKCTHCGKEACSKCFQEWGGLCKDCTG